MSEHSDEIHIKRPQLIAAAGLVLFALFAATTARLTGFGVAKSPTAPVAAMRELRFSEGGGGSLLVFATDGDAPVGALGPDHHGFVRVVLKGLERDRMIHAVPLDAPVRLVELTDGRRLVEDPATGRSINLRAFGAGNTGAFESLFELGRKQQ